jgi:hypothetical protein
MQRSHSILLPDVTVLCRRFPAGAGEHASQVSKIPTIIYYDRSGNVKAIGAEAIQGKTQLDAMTGDWVKAEWYGIKWLTRSSNLTFPKVQNSFNIQSGH